MTTPDETQIADLLRLLPPAPERWTAEARELPRRRAELDRVLPVIGQDQDDEDERSREDFKPDDRLVGSAPGGRGSNDDVEGHMHESEKRPSGHEEEKRPSGLDEDSDGDVEGHMHESEKRPSGHSEEKRPSGLDEDFDDDDVEGHMHESEKRPSGKRPSGLDEESDEDV